MVAYILYGEVYDVCYFKTEKVHVHFSRKYVPILELFSGRKTLIHNAD
jgi:hypothetical protein